MSILPSSTTIAPPVSRNSTTSAPLRRQHEAETATPRKTEKPRSYFPARFVVPHSSALADMTIRFKRGLDLPIAGQPEQVIEPGPAVNRVAVVGPDYVGMKPTMAVEEGDQVVTGQVLFRDKRQPGVCYTSPGCGTVVAIHRGQKRVLLSVVIELDGNAARAFTRYSESELDSIPREEVIRQLVQSGAWTALRERPFDRIPSPMAFGPIDLEEAVQKTCSQDTIPQDRVLRMDRGGIDSVLSLCPNAGTCSGGCGAAKKRADLAQNINSGAKGDDGDSSRIPAALFITAMDTRPLAADPEIVIGERAGYFHDGLRVLGRLGIAKNYLCAAPGAKLPGSNLDHIKRVDFGGPHPAGLVGTHIHSLEPVGRNRRVWHINYQDVIAIGRLFRTGKVDLERVVSLAGPSVERPRLIRTRVGADLGDLVEGQLAQQEELPQKDQPEDGHSASISSKHRVISGSVLAGRQATGNGDVDEMTAFLGRYDLQVSVLPEFEHRELFGWIMPGMEKFSIKNVVLSKLLGRRKRFAFDTAVHGGRRAIVPIGAYQKVMPLDILPDFLLKALSIGDLEQSESLGCLELTEEDVSLLTYVCPGKADYGVMLRQVLDELAKEV